MDSIAMHEPFSVFRSGMDWHEFVSQERTNFSRQSSSKALSKRLRQDHRLFVFRQKKVIELLDKNYRIHCSVHNQVTTRENVIGYESCHCFRLFRVTSTSNLKLKRSSSTSSLLRNEPDTWIWMIFSGRRPVLHRFYGHWQCDFCFRLLHAFNAEGIHFRWCSVAVLE